MIRLTVLSLLCTVLAAYAFRDWFKSLCGLIVMMAVLEHPDMPKHILGYQGLNPWNLIMLCVLAGWLLSRRSEQRVNDFPKPIVGLLAIYMLVIVISVARMLADQTGLPYTTGELVSEYLVNCMKWVLPGLLLFTGCRDEKRLKFALGAILILYILLAVQVIRWMPLSVALGSGEEMAARSLKILKNEVGYHRVNLSMMLAGAFWAIVAAVPVAKTIGRKAAVWAAALIVFYGQALTGGRAGYVTWAAVGLILCLIRWRKYLLLAPVVAILIIVLLPGVSERIMVGISSESPRGGEQIDEYTFTAGRNIAWKHVIAKIKEGPVLGFGRLAMLRTGVSDDIFAECGDFFEHPHNAYLEIILENGVTGLCAVLPFYLTALFVAMSLFRDSRNPIFTVVGGIACALILALLVASASSQTFYPREGAVGMWAAIGIAIRVWVQRRKALAGISPGERSSDAVIADIWDGMSAPAEAEMTVRSGGIQRRYAW